MLMHGHGPKEKLVGERFLELRKLLSRPERHGWSGRRVRIGQDVEGIDPVPAVHFHFLIDEAWRDSEAPVRLDANGDPCTSPVAAVDVFVDREVGLYRVHPAAEVITVAGDPGRRLSAKRHVEAELGVVAGRAVVDLTDADFA